MKKLLLSIVLMIIWFWPIVSHAEDDVPQEQKQLTFEETEAPNSEHIGKLLFQTSIQGTNTIQAKTAQIGLFSKPDPIVKMEAESQTEEATSNIMMLMIIATVIVIVIAMFIFIFLKLSKPKDVKI